MPEMLPVSLDFLQTQRTCKNDTISYIFHTRRKNNVTCLGGVNILCSAVIRPCCCLFKQSCNIRGPAVAQRVFSEERSPPKKEGTLVSTELAPSSPRLPVTLLVLPRSPSDPTLLPAVRFGSSNVLSSLSWHV